MNAGIEVPKNQTFRFEAGASSSVVKTQPLKKRQQPRNVWFFGTFIPAPIEQTFKL